MRFERRLAVGLPLLLLGCSTIDPGSNVVGPNVSLDEDFFYCRIQPEIIAAHGCASGTASEGGSCHSSRTAMRLVLAAETDPPPTCDGNDVTGAVPPSYADNFLAVQTEVGPDPLSTPFYTRPTGIEPHERVIFAEGSPEADLILEWLARGSD